MMTASDESDEQLLSAWVRSRDEAAFYALVHRHAGLVLGAARRRLGSEEGAEEAMQNVFTALAKKASVVHGAGGLGGWLHRAAVLESASLQRREQRRRERMKRLAEDAAAGDSAGTVSGLLPVLDEAVNALPEPERRVILLHWYERRTFAEIAGSLGISTDAAKKRGQRAMERLAAAFSRRGIAGSAAALAAIAASGLNAEAGGALRARVAAEAVGAISSAMPVPSGVATGVKWGVVAAFTAGMAVPLTISREAEKPGGQAATTEAGKQQVDGRQPPHTDNVKADAETALQKLERALRRTVPAEEKEAFQFATQELIFALAAGDLPGAQKLLEGYRGLLPADPETGSKTPPPLLLSSFVECLYARWAEVDEAAARETALTFAVAEQREAAWHGAISRLAATDPHLAVETTLSLPVPEQEKRFYASAVIVMAWAPVDPAAALNELVARQCFPEASTDAKVWMREYPFRMIARDWSISDPDACMEWMGKHYPDHVEAFLRGSAWEMNLASPQGLVAGALKQHDGMLREDLLRLAFISWPERQPADAIRAFASLPEAARTQSFAAAVAHDLAAGDPETARAVAATLPEGAARQALELAAVATLVADDPQKAVAAAMEYAPGPLRRQTLRRIAETWMRQDGPAAEAWIHGCADLEECRTELLETTP